MLLLLYWQVDLRIYLKSNGIGFLTKIAIFKKRQKDEIKKDKKPKGKRTKGKKDKKAKDKKTKLQKDKTLPSLRHHFFDNLTFITR